MSQDNTSKEDIGRRSALRKIGVASGFALGGIAGTSPVQAASPTVFEADTSGIAGLDSASIVIEEQSDSSRMTHQYSWDPEVVQEFDAPTGASVRLDVPGHNPKDSEQATASLDAESLQNATAVVEPAANPGTARTTDGQSTSDVTADDWNTIPYVETKSLLCGVLAESELPIDSQYFSGAGTVYVDYDFTTANYDETCEDEWYVPGAFNTEWFTDDSTSNKDGSDITAEANYRNEDFPLSDTVYADHTFDVSPSSHDMSYNHYGDLSYIALEGKSSTGYR